VQSITGFLIGFNIYYDILCGTIYIILADVEEMKSRTISFFPFSVGTYPKGGFPFK
jgi:hypothetical protein